MHVLAICDTSESLTRVFTLLGRKAQIVYRTTPREIAEIKTLDDLSVYRMIVLAAFNWRIPTTGPGLASHFRDRFRGPIVAVGNLVQWRSSMKSGGCDHALPDSEETARFLHDLLFPPT